MKQRDLILFCLLQTSTKAWLPQSAIPSRRSSTRTRRSSHFGVMLSSSGGDDLSEFDYLLQEVSNPADVMPAHQTSVSSGNRRIMVQFGNNPSSTKAVILSSSAAAPTSTTTTTMDDEQLQEQSSTTNEAENTGGDSGGGGEEYDPYAEVEAQMDSKIGRIQEMQEKPSLEKRFKQMDLQDIVITLIIPGIVTFAGLRWGFNKVSSRVTENADTTLDSFAQEMIYHDGNFEEMRMCHADYSRQLLWMGPRKNDAMIKRYLQAYAKKKTVSPQSIRYVLTICEEDLVCAVGFGFFNRKYSHIVSDPSIFFVQFEIPLVHCLMFLLFSNYQKNVLPKYWFLYVKKWVRTKLVQQEKFYSLDHVFSNQKKEKQH